MSELQQLRDEITQLQTALTIKNGTIDRLKEQVGALEAKYQRDVYGLNNEGDPIGGEPAGGYANDNARLKARVAELEAQKVLGTYPKPSVLKDRNVTYSTSTQQLERDAFNLAYSCAVDNGWTSAKDLARYMWEHALASCVTPQQNPARQVSKGSMWAVERAFRDAEKRALLSGCDMVEAFYLAFNAGIAAAPQAEQPGGDS